MRQQGQKDTTGGSKQVQKGRLLFRIKFLHKEVCICTHTFRSTECRVESGQKGLRVQEGKSTQVLEK